MSSTTSTSEAAGDESRNDMNFSPTTKTPADCSPVFSIAGVMPGGSNMAWKTACPNPDAPHANVRRGCGGPSFSVAGVTAGTAQTAWRTAMPDPTRDVLDAHGHVITRIEASARAEIAAHRHGVLTLSPARTATSIAR